MAPKRNKPQPPHPVVCACGCETPFLVPHPRWKANKTGMFFFKQTHFSLGMEKHPNWRGGPAIYGSAWTRTADRVRERDGVCQRCGKTAEENGRGLDVHHVIPVRVSGDNSLENLIALCLHCHRAAGLAEDIHYPRTGREMRECLHCGQPFELDRHHFKLCSEACKKERQKQQIAAHPRPERQPGGSQYAAHRARIAAWLKTNAEHVNAYHREKRAEAPEKHREYERNYYAKHKGESSEAGRAYYAGNREKVLARSRARYAAKKDEILAQQKARRLRSN